MSHILLRPVVGMGFEILNTSLQKVGSVTLQRNLVSSTVTVSANGHIYEGSNELEALEFAFGEDVTYQFTEHSSSNEYSVFLKFSDRERTLKTASRVASLSGLALGERVFYEAIEEASPDLLELVLCHYGRFGSWNAASRLIAIKIWRRGHGVKQVYRNLVNTTT